MTNMALNWHHKNISNKIIVFLEFWQLLYVLFGSFDCDCTPFCNIELAKPKLGTQDFYKD